MRIFLISCFLAYSFIGQAQNKQNVFIQINPPQLFYVDVNGKLIASSEDGFLFFPSFDTTCVLSISFSKQQLTQFKFNFDGNKISSNYFLQQINENNWQLVDLSNQFKINGIKIDNQQISIDTSTSYSFDVFSKQLANAVNDQEIRNSNNIVKNGIVQPKVPNAQSIPLNIASLTNSVVKLIYQDKNKMIFIDQSKKQIDTITVIFNQQVAKDSNTIFPDSNFISNYSIIGLKDSSKIDIDSLQNNHKSEDVKIDTSNHKLIADIIPNDSLQTHLDSSKNLINSSIEKSDSVPLVPSFDKNDVYLKDTNKIEEKRILIDSEKTQGNLKSIDSISINPNKLNNNLADSNKLISAKIVDTSNTTKKSIKIVCKIVADERDLILFRRKMILMNNQNEVLFFAGKEFRQKCYSTLQIRNLSFIFLNDKDKFNFFKLAYNNVIDPENFEILERFLNDEQEILNFRNLIKKP
ncbi:MAG: DUF4476 domain-containing protein [Chitinophagaceae bacterium]|nr:DUF4476 domain-containing protein [Chitinophagaceae bacterium]